MSKPWALAIPRTGPPCIAPTSRSSPALFKAEASTTLSQCQNLLPNVPATNDPKSPAVLTLAYKFKPGASYVVNKGVVPSPIDNGSS